MIPISSSNPPVYPTWRWAGEETTHFSLVLKFNRPLPRACYVPGLREAVYLCNLTGFWVDSASGVTRWGPEEEKRRIRGSFPPLSAALDSGFGSCCISSATPASAMQPLPRGFWLQLLGQAATRWPRPKPGNINSSVYSCPSPQGWQHLPALVNHRVRLILPLWLLISSIRRLLRGPSTIPKE